MKRRNTNGIPKFAYGGQVGNEILDFQRQYNPFTGDLPTYGMVGSQQPGAWMFFDDAWLRTQIPQPPSNTVDAPPSGPPIMGPSNEGPDGGGADRYTDDWRGVPGFNVTDVLAPDYENLESFAGYNTQDQPGYDYGQEMVSGMGPVSSGAANNAVSVMDINETSPTYGSVEDYQGQVGHGMMGYGGQPAAPSADYSRAGTGTQEIGGRVWSGGREPSTVVGPAFSLDEFVDLTPATNMDYVPAEEYVAPGAVQFAEPINYGGPSLSPETMAAMQDQLSAYAAGQDRGWNVGVEVDPGQAGAAIGAQAAPGSMVGMADYVQGQMGAGGTLGSQGTGSMANMANSPVGQAAIAALGGFNSTVSPEAFVSFGEPPGRGFENKSAFSGLSAMAGSPAGGPVGIGGLASPGSPGFGAANALADMYGLDIGLGLTPGQPMEPTNTVAGPATPGATVGVAPSMDPLSGLTESQIDALAAGYHDQAPAVGQASPVAGFSSSLEAMQAAAEAKGRGGYSQADDFSKGSTNTSSGGHYAGVNSRGEPVFVGSDKQGATGQDKGDTGDNGSGSGKGGGEDNAGKDSNSDTSGNSSAEGGTGGTGQGGGSGDPEGAGGTGEGGQGGGKKAGGRIRASRGLPSMAEQVRQAGRGKDKVLAHITPGEAAKLDAMQGGASINPHTGAREYGFLDDVGDFFGDAAKAVAPIAGGLLGGAFGGPLGAAAGAALGTALVGGNLQQSLMSGAVSGIGAYAAPKLSSGLGGLFGGGNGVESGGMGANGMQTGGGSQSYAGDDGGGFLSGLSGNPLAMVGLGAAGGLGAGYMLGGDDDDGGGQQRTQAPAPWVPRQGGLAPRAYRPYEGDVSTYGQTTNPGGWSYYDKINPEVVYYAEGGRVDDTPSREKMRETLGREIMSGGTTTNPMAVLQTAQMAMPPRPMQQPQGLPAPQMQEPQQLQQPMPGSPQQMMGQWQQRVMPPWLIDRDDESDDRVANLIWKQAGGGYIRGPGDGQADKIPAMLSDGEYVVDASSVAALGSGSNAAGADRLDQMIQNIREHNRSNGKGLPPMAKSPMEYMGR